MLEIAARHADVVGFTGLLGRAGRDHSLTHFSADGLDRTRWSCVRGAGGRSRRAPPLPGARAAASRSPTTGEAAASRAGRAVGRRRRGHLRRRGPRLPVPAARHRRARSPRQLRERRRAMGHRDLDDLRRSPRSTRRSTAVAEIAAELAAMPRRADLASWAACRPSPTRDGSSPRPARQRSTSTFSCCPSVSTFPWLTVRGDAAGAWRSPPRAARREGDATMVVPRLEAPHVTEQADVFGIRTWDETDDPVALVAGQSARRTASPSATAPGPASSSTCSGACRDARRRRAARSPGRCGRARTRPRSTRCGTRRPPPTGWRRSSRAGGVPLVGRTEATYRPTSAAGS